MNKVKSAPTREEFNLQCFKNVVRQQKERFEKLERVTKNYTADSTPSCYIYPAGLITVITDLCDEVLDTAHIPKVLSKHPGDICKTCGWRRDTHDAFFPSPKNNACFNFEMRESHE